MDISITATKSGSKSRPKGRPGNSWTISLTRKLKHLESEHINFRDLYTLTTMYEPKLYKSVWAG